jgi:hypothetical protein
VKVLRCVGGVLLRVVGAVVAGVVLLAAGTYAAHGVILIIKAIP